MATTPTDYEAVTIEEIAAKLDEKFHEAYRYTSKLSALGRKNLKRETRPLYASAIAISLGFTPLRYVGAEWARLRPGNATKAVCDECGHTYSMRSTGLMRRHAKDKHGRDGDSWTVLLDEARERNTAVLADETSE
jgi:hypothetical protein